MPAVAVPADITVIGAGIVGCAVAFELAARGASVQILDDRPAGMGATQASAGMLAPFVEAREGGPLLELALRSLDLFDTFVDRAAGESGLPVPYRRTGTLDAALQDDAMEQHRALARTLAARGVPCELLDAGGVRTLEPQLSEGAVGGLLIPAHGFVSAGALTRALAAAARRHRAQILEQGRVRRVAPAGADLVVHTDRGSLTSGAVVLAAGSWTPRIEVDGLRDRVPVRPVRGQLLHLAWEGEPLRRVTWGRRCYLVPWDDGTLLVGATVEDAGFDERATAAGVRDLIDAASELVPRVASAGFREARVGLRPGTPDELPVIGRSARIPNLFYATGHYRSGVLLAPLTAQLAAGALLDRRDDDPALAMTSPGRFGDL
jgi:glycine oxidase